MSGLIHVGAWDGAEYLDDPRHLLLFEPQAVAFSRLHANLGQNPKASLWRAACGAEPALKHMYSSLPDDNSSLLEPGVPWFKHSGRTITFSGSELVVVLPLDFVTTGVSPFRYYGELVIDTQGYELEVLKGAERTLKHLSRVSLEIHDPEVYPDAATAEQVIDFMAGWNCRRDDVGSAGVCDLVFTR